MSGADVIVYAIASKSRAAWRVANAAASDGRWISMWICGNNEDIWSMNRSACSSNTADETVGVAQPVMVTFDRPVADRAPAEAGVRIRSAPAVEGKFYWVSDTELRWRPHEFWPAGTAVTDVVDRIRALVEEFNPGALAQRYLSVVEVVRDELALRTARAAANAITAKGIELRSVRGIESIHLAIGLAQWRHRTFTNPRKRSGITILPGRKAH